MIPDRAQSMPSCHGVLLVDDDEPVRRVIIQVLSEAGFAVATASNGAEALSHLHASNVPPCLILLDLMMPVMDGRTFREEQMKDPLLAQIPVVVLTADINVDQIAAAMNVAGGVAKPFRLDVLLDQVARFCRP
jgi:CheY-like chemotaxis protein